MIKADTIDELAKKLGLPVEQVKKTVARQNELWAKGEDVDFGKEKHRLSPINKPPYYGCKTSGRLLCTMDGIVIDENMNAMDVDNKPIPGLYVIGNDSGCYFANEYPNLSTGMAWPYRDVRPPRWPLPREEGLIRLSSEGKRKAPSRPLVTAFLD